MNQTNRSKNPELIIVGASTRSTAYSAVRAGFQPFCVDQYVDQDLKEIAEVIPKIDDSSHWLRLLNQRPSQDWIYTGALENQPDLIEQISQKHRLNGCHTKILKLARNPFFLEQILSETPIQVPPCLPSGISMSKNSPIGNEKWLYKPFRGSAGYGIHFTDSIPSDFGINENLYLQRYQSGIPLSALFISFREVTVLVGISRQFIGEAALNAKPFQFCGGITLSPVPLFLRAPLEQLGQTIAQGCQIQGIFGCDLILDPGQENRIWLNEVNPRYTALTELFELQYRLPILMWHLAACRSFQDSQPETDETPEQLQKLLRHAENQPLTQIAKGILYASQDILSPEIDWTNNFASNFYQIPEVADIPQQGTLIKTGSPICSVYGAGTNHATCLQSLSARIVDIQRLYQSKSQTSSEVFNTLSAAMKLQKPLFF